MADFWSQTLRCVVGHRLAGPASALNASPREQTLLDEAANNVPRRDVDLLNERRRVRRGVQAHIAQRGHFPLIVDDPIKANDADSEVARRGAIDWFRGTALSRLDDPAASLVWIAMQRLHVDDLAGILIEQGWPKLVLPAIATEAADYVTGPDEVHHRPVGQLLQPDRDSFAAIERLKREIGSPPDGNMIKAAWLGRYNTLSDGKNFQRVVLSCDPAGKAGIRNDYTAITVIGLQQQAIHLLEVSRGHWTVIQMREQIIALAGRGGGADLVIIADTSSGIGADPVGEGADPSQCRRPPSGGRPGDPHEPATGSL